MRALNRLISFCYISFLSSAALAEDIEFMPPVGGGVSIKKSGNSELLFRVTPDGKVAIPSMPTSLTGTPLCWEEATGILQKCSIQASSDTSRPVITVNAPSSSTVSIASFDVTATDDVEIAYTRNVNLQSNVGDEIYAPEGASTVTKTTTIATPLNAGTITGMFVAADTSGNVTKQSYSITSAQTALRPGSYTPVGLNTFPANFDCTSSSSIPVFAETLNGATLESIIVSVGPGSNGDWDFIANGYAGSFSARPVASSSHASGSFGISTYSYPPGTPQTKVSLVQTSIPFNSISQTGSGSGVSYQVGHVGELRVLNSSPPRIELDISMQCNINNAGFVTGDQARFTAELGQQ